ncbi:hypothetical protein Pmani_006435 [Petrolisthes manimaculis]|uniref:Uncharacterized protein n=1 Tax=Petrolisthes manimaculis TaxID=1843537 RepID=A0AAE1Q9T7_9EUCA|nr:hypothetical protein Pmani_006435 [Petrolisthes manimaculis]
MVATADTSGGGRRVKEAGVWERIVGTIVVVVAKESETRLVHTNAFVLPTLPKNTTTVVITIAYQNYAVVMMKPHLPSVVTITTRPTTGLPSVTNTHVPYGTSLKKLELA